MCSVLFLKGPTYLTAQYNAQHNPNTYWYSFNFAGRNSIFEYAFARNPPPIPHGNTYTNLFAINRILKCDLVILIIPIIIKVSVMGTISFSFLNSLFHRFHQVNLCVLYFT